MAYPDRDYVLASSYPTCPLSELGVIPDDFDLSELSGLPLVEYLWRAELYLGWPINWKYLQDGQLPIYERTTDALELVRKDEDFDWAWRGKQHRNIVELLFPEELPSIKNAVSTFDKEAGIPMVNIFFKQRTDMPTWSCHSIWAIAVVIGRRLG